MGLFSTTHIHQSRTEHVPYCKEVNITEKKAPTDESVRLLNNMQDKAQRNIIATIKIEENFLKAVAIYYRDEMISDRMTYHIRFELNGKEYMIEDYIDKFEWRQEMSKSYMGLGNEVIFRALHKKFSEMVANELMKQSPDFLRGVVGGAK
jgi:hypothetical protein